MRVLLDSGSYHCMNVGDIAMLQAAVERLHDLLPRASIAVVTNTPELLARHCPGVQAVPLRGRIMFLSDRFFGRADRFLPRPLRDTLGRGQDALRSQWPTGLAALIAAKRALVRRQDYAMPRAYVDALTHAGLVVATGAGVFTDAFAENAIGVLATLELALLRNIPTAVMGHGIGPVSNPALRQKMAHVLPRLDLIALREDRESRRLVESLGVSSDRVIVTGDDALEMANRSARQQLGDAIGVNVRLAGYAGVSEPALGVIRPAVQSAAARVGARLVPVPIAHHRHCHDGIAIAEVLAGYLNAPGTVAELDTPAAAIARVAQCRLVVTGSYHAAVFALAQGIPAVALAATPYYLNKFAGLAELFPGGCETIALNETNTTAKIESAILSAWTSAPHLRESLLRAARAQVDAGRSAYRRLASLACGAAHRGTMAMQPRLAEPAQLEAERRIASGA